MAVAILLLVGVIPFDGFQGLPLIGGNSLFALAGYVVLPFSLLRLRQIATLIDRPYVFLVVANVLGTLVALVAFYSGARPIAHELLTAWQMLVLFVLVKYCVTTVGTWQTPVRVLVLGLITSFIAYLVLYQLGIGVVDLEGANRVRFVFGYETNHVSHACALGIVLVVTTLDIWTSAKRNIIAIVGLPAMLVVMYLSNSRGGNVTLVGGIAVVVALSLTRKGQRRIRNLALVVSVLAVVYALGGERARERVGSRIPHGVAGTIDIRRLTGGRSEIMQAGLDVAVMTPLGLGIGNAKFEIGPRVWMFGMTKLNPQNEYLRMAMECGWLGLLFFVMALGKMARATYREFQHGGRIWPLATLMTLLVSYMSLATTYDKVTWAALGVIAGALELSKRNGRRVDVSPGVVAQRLERTTPGVGSGFRRIESPLA